MENLQEKIKKIKPSIVAIGFTPNSQQITIIGSGFIVTEDGKIATVAHLFNQLNEEQIGSLKANVMVGKQGEDLEVYKWVPLILNKDQINIKDDVAVLKLDLSQEKDVKLTKAELDDSEKVEIGQEAYFIGFPYAAQLMNSGFGVTLIVNKGIVSNIKRDGVDLKHPRNWFIIDAISNPGNSGCPIVDIESNKVIGIMSISFRTPSLNPNYKDLEIREPMHIAGAKPINLVKNLLEQ
ncbi:MAG: serine protease [Nanoarchaeota archaeon]